MPPSLAQFTSVPEFEVTFSSCRPSDSGKQDEDKLYENEHARARHECQDTAAGLQIEAGTLMYVRGMK